MAKTVKLTKRVIDESGPTDRPQFLWDSELRGFGIRTEPTGTKSFVLRYRPKGTGRSGTKRFCTIGRYGCLTVDQARAQARTILGAVASGEDPAAPTPPQKAPLTFSEAAELFLAEHVQAKRKATTQRDYQWMLRSSAVAKLQKRAVTRITLADIAHLHVEMRDTPSQANRLIAVISSLYTFLEKRGLVPDGMNPAKRTEKYRETRRERFLSNEEIERLGAAIAEGETVGLPWDLEPEKRQSKHIAKPENQRVVLSPDVANAFRLLTLTGARLREILHLRWEHVDLERGLLLLPDSKTGRKTIVLNDAAVRVLRGHHRVGPFVICGKDPNYPRSDLKRPWQLLCKRASLTGIRIHDLRHTFASIGVGSSLGLPIVGKLLGHHQPQTTARYAHLDADPLRRASNIIGDKIDAAMREGIPDGEVER